MLRLAKTILSERPLSFKQRSGVRRGNNRAVDVPSRDKRERDQGTCDELAQVGKSRRTYKRPKELNHIQLSRPYERAIKAFHRTRQFEIQREKFNETYQCFQATYARRVNRVLKVMMILILSTITKKTAQYRTAELYPLVHLFQLIRFGFLDYNMKHILSDRNK